MAVVLPSEREAEWLHGDPDALVDLFEPYPDDDLDYYPVSKRVNDPATDEPSLIDPVTT